MLDSASLHSVPHDALGAGIPRPIKLRNASVKMALGICMAIATMIVPIMLGIRCLTKIRPVEAPSVFAASTNSLFFKLSTCPRTIRAILTQ